MMNEMISPYVYPGLITSVRFSITPEMIVDRICDHLFMSKEKIYSKSRKHEIVFARHLVYFFVRRLTQMSLTETGMIFMQDHATVLNGVKRINERLQTDKKTMHLVSTIQLLLGANNTYVDVDYISNIEHGKVVILAYDDGVIRPFHYKHSHTIGTKMFGSVKFFEEAWHNIGNYLYLSVDHKVCIKEQGYQVFMQTLG